MVAMFENEAVACRDVKQQVGGGGAAEYAGGNNVPEPISLIFEFGDLRGCNRGLNFQAQRRQIYRVRLGRYVLHRGPAPQIRDASQAAQQYPNTTFRRRDRA